MSRFFTDRYSSLIPYVPGEQPRDMKYVKLNTNESPFPPSSGVSDAVRAESEKLNLYSDPECTDLRRAMSEVFGVKTDNVVMTNGSDEALNFAFMAFADEKRPLVFPDVTYGFYPVFAQLDHIPYREIPLTEDFSINAEDYLTKDRVAVIANPNAPTGTAISLGEIEKIAAFDPDSVVIVDEAYVDFGAESAVKLTEKYENLLVIGTFSKSRSLAGGRLGFAIGSKALTECLNTVRYSTNPYNVNRLTSAAGVAALRDNGYYMENCRVIAENREYAKNVFSSLGFEVLPSKANFLFARSDRIGGKELYLALKERGVLIRHFDKPRISDWNRVTVGTREQMDALFAKIREILE